MGWSNVESPGTLHFEGLLQGSIRAWMQANQKGRKDTFDNFCVTQNFAFPNFCKWVYNFDWTCLKTCFMPRKKCQIFLDCHTHDLSLWRTFLLAFWYVFMFCIKFVNKCKNSFIIGFSNHSNGSHCLNLVKTLKWSSIILSTQAYNHLPVMK